jgi:ubiquinone/menaquinone biosynthesis C-methylase UbiE
MDTYLYEDLYLLEETHFWHRSKRSRVYQLLSTYLHAKHPRILDVGCGTGKNVEVFGKLGESWGIDIAKEAIYFCKKRGLKNVKLARSEKIPFKDAYVDAVTLLDVLEHVEEDPTLSEIYRILKPGGICVISVPANPALWSQWDVVLHHKRRYTKDMLLYACERNMFHVEYLTGMQTYLVVPAVVVRYVKARLYKGKEYPSDFTVNSKILNEVLYGIARTEQAITNVIRLPQGLSYLAVVRKT